MQARAQPTSRRSTTSLTDSTTGQSHCCIGFEACLAPSSNTPSHKFVPS